MPIIQPGRNAWTLQPAPENGLLVDAQDYYLAFYRAALEAQQYILLSGWQFDSGVQLLRGDDVATAAPAGGEVRLLKFLNHLCESKPALEIFILAWDFHVAFALEREWMQTLLFHWTTHERLRFRLDDSHVSGGCHHQKFVVIDGTLAFLGGIDLCEARWDDRGHSRENPLRLSHGEPQKPYHDVQAYFTGSQVAGALKDLFANRWVRAGAEPFKLPSQEEVALDGYHPRGALRFPAATVALSQTDPRAKDEPTIREVADLIADSFAAARQLIYLETQYFSSREVCQHLIERMRASGQPPLEIVLVLNQKAEALKEEIAVGLRQADNLRSLRRVAAETGHALGCYTVAAKGEGGETSVYIHSKLVIIDDRFITVGSANLTNRSMGVDTELHASWEEDPPGGSALGRAIRRARVSLLAEHLGLSGVTAVRRLAAIEGLVAHLDSLIDKGEGALRHHPSPTDAEVKILDAVDPQALPFDPEQPGDDPAAEEMAAQRQLFRGGISQLWQRLTGS